MKSAPRILVLSGSIDIDHPASRLADSAQLLRAQRGGDVVRVSLVDYPMPLMGATTVSADEMPPAAASLSQMIRHHDALFLTCPVWNGIPAPLVVNMMAWTLLPPDAHRLQVWRNKPVAIAAVARRAEEAGPGMAGLLAAFEGADAAVFTVPDAALGRRGAFDDAGWIRDAAEAAEHQELCNRLWKRAADDCNAVTLA